VQALADPVTVFMATALFKADGVLAVVLEVLQAPIAITVLKAHFACTERAMAWGDAFVIWVGHLQAAMSHTPTAKSRVLKQAARQ